jgi:hypothetical protein
MHLHAIITRLLYAAPRQYSFKFLHFINYLSWLLSSITPHEPPRHRRMTHLRYSPADLRLLTYRQTCRRPKEKACAGLARPTDPRVTIGD